MVCEIQTKMQKTVNRERVKNEKNMMKVREDMNARQIKKHLKQKIEKLKSDNKLMRDIIADSPTMQELYDLYNKPVNVVHTAIDFQGYKATRVIDRPIDDICKKYYIREIENEIFDVVKDHINYVIDTDAYMPTITGSIYIGK